jgi:DNA-binding NtrC family response regulator
MQEIDAAPHQTVVLVVEPDPDVRAMAANALEGEGFAVVETSSAGSAATIIQRSTNIRVVFTDAIPPGALNGFDLARLAKAHDPRMLVIVVAGALPSGFSGTALEARFLPKPYRITEVIRLIRASETLADPTAAEERTSA